MKYVLSAEITISIYTEVEAESLEEALKVAEYRDLQPVLGTGGETRNDHWMCDELDGEPQNITHID